MLPDLHLQLEEYPLPESFYTGGVEDVRAMACSRCTEVRKEVQALQNEARMLDAQCKARIEYHRREAGCIEDLLIEKRRIEAKLYFQQAQTGSGGLDGHFCAITKVNQTDDIAVHPDSIATLPANIDIDLLAKCADPDRSRYPASAHTK
jgi:hypothetical protein